MSSKRLRERYFDLKRRLMQSKYLIEEDLNQLKKLRDKLNKEYKKEGGSFHMDKKGGVHKT